MDICTIYTLLRKNLFHKYITCMMNKLKYSTPNAFQISIYFFRKYLKYSEYYECFQRIFHSWEEIVYLDI